MNVLHPERHKACKIVTKLLFCCHNVFVIFFIKNTVMVKNKHFCLKKISRYITEQITMGLLCTICLQREPEIHLFITSFCLVKANKNDQFTYNAN